MAHQVRAAFSKVFGSSAHKLGMHQVYDVSHNIAKQEMHTLPDGSKKKVLVHRWDAPEARWRLPPCQGTACSVWLGLI
jgi:tRNA-splicing ligase RtcB